MPKYSARRAFLWQLIAKNRKRRLALHTALRTVYQRRQLLLQVACLTVLLLANNNGAAVLSWSCRRFQRNLGWFPGREIVFVQRMLVRGGGGGENGVWQMGEYVFLWRLPSPSHLNQLFCNLHDLWIEFSACLERRLLKRRTTVALSDLASRTYAGVEPINLSRT